MSRPFSDVLNLVHITTILIQIQEHSLDFSVKLKKITAFITFISHLSLVQLNSLTLTANLDLVLKVHNRRLMLNNLDSYIALRYVHIPTCNHTLT